MATANVGYATMSIIPSFKGFEGKLDSESAPVMKKAGAKAGDDFGSAMGSSAEKSARGGLAKLAAGVGALFVGGKLLEFGKDSFEAFSAQNEAASKAEVVFGAAAGDIQSFASSSAKNLGISKTAALDAAGTFGNLFRAMGIGVDTSAQMSTKLLQLSSDLASFNNANPEDVLAALKSGLVGETEPLRQFGVNLNEARIQAEALRLGLVKGNVNAVDVQAKSVAVANAQAKLNDLTKSGTASSLELSTAKAALASAQQDLSQKLAGSVPPLDAAQKAQAAYSLILQDTSLAQGDFARTADGAANKGRVASAMFEDLKATLGEKIAPVGNFFLDKEIWALDWISNWWTEHGPGIKQWFKETFGEDPWGNFERGAIIVSQKVDELWGQFQLGTFVVSQKVDELWADFERGSAIVYEKIGPAWEWLGDKVLWFKDHVLDPTWGFLETVPEGLGRIFSDTKNALDPLLGTLQSLLDNSVVKWLIEHFGGTVGTGAGLLNSGSGDAGGAARNILGATKPKTNPNIGKPFTNGMVGPQGANLSAGPVLAPVSTTAAPVVAGDLIINTTDPAEAARETRRQLRTLQTMAVG